jgi:hypothetical protein
MTKFCSDWVNQVAEFAAVLSPCAPLPMTAIANSLNRAVLEAELQWALSAM